ncbi:oxalate:formate antiporter [Nocardioides oleivorans]|uniref:Oxalate:formate antiporter n=1 Tax=Nocardioides oleivorans TaxID=273676 RepID=A0A4Q2RZG3_9ACTN|nr:oxalate:formate antiporter [Nocardioides oleivorans]RYB93465.1 oxalate:formate antiporter [Nocardioides oleivorans]
MSEPSTTTTTTSPVLVALAWLLVGIPLAYGLWQTIDRASALFTG